MKLKWMLACSSSLKQSTWTLALISLPPTVIITLAHFECNSATEAHFRLKQIKEPFTCANQFACNYVSTVSPRSGDCSTSDGITKRCNAVERCYGGKVHSLRGKKFMSLFMSECVVNNISRPAMSTLHPHVTQIHKQNKIRKHVWHWTCCQMANI